MKKLTIIALVASQLAAAAPASAADLIDSAAQDSTRMGSFAGARLRISLDREPRERVRAGLTLAPTALAVRADGATRLRIGEGVEFGLSERRGPALSLNGRTISELAEGPRGPDGRRQNVSTLGWVAIGVGVVVVGVAGYAIWLTHEMNSNEGD
ncbi:MAG TPA: hypothetical protein VD887_03280 [Allosphingosinicella sp.]|nr:hypothetical protein [Allosphingosinicella sp.]